jgi:hypothetical protein
MVEDINSPKEYPQYQLPGGSIRSTAKSVKKKSRLLKNSWTRKIKKIKKRKKEKKNPTKLIFREKPKSTGPGILPIPRVQAVLQKQKMILIRKSLMSGSDADFRF